jgi:hypothetical protein
MNEASSAYEGTYADTQGPASPRRASTSLVSEFLGLALADGPVAVAAIEAKAREAGLLGPSQKITGAKLFKQAKKILRFFPDAAVKKWRRRGSSAASR